MIIARINTGTYTQTKRHLLVAMVADVDVDWPIEVGGGFRRPASSGEETSIFISKPDKTAFCVLQIKICHNLIIVIYSENKDLCGYRLQEKQMRSLDVFVNVFEGIDCRKKLIICSQSFYSISVENYSIEKVSPPIRR